MRSPWVILLGLLCLFQAGCKKSSSQPQVANVIITDRHGYQTSGGFDRFQLKNVGNGTAYYVTVRGFAANPSTLAPGEQGTCEAVGFNGASNVSWSNTP